MNGLTDYVLGSVVSYGSPLIGLFLMLGAMGIPLPTTLLVVASGAFVRQGVLAPDVALIGLCGAVVGDSLSYAAGRMGHGWLARRFGSHGSGAALKGWQQADRVFKKGGGVTIYLTRWLLTSIAIPTNLVAGGCGYRFDRFLLFDFLGETTWIALFGGLGYWLGSQWELAGQLLSDFGSLALGLMVLSAGIYLGTKSLYRRRTHLSSKEINNVYQNQPVYRSGYLRWIPGSF